MQQTSPKTIIMSSNGTSNPKTFTFDWGSLMQGILAAGTLSCVGFFIKMNSTMAVVQEKQVQEQQFRMEMKQDMNEMKLDVRDIRERVIRAEKDTQVPN